MNALLSQSERREIARALLRTSLTEAPNGKQLRGVLKEFRIACGDPHLRTAYGSGPFDADFEAACRDLDVRLHVPRGGKPGFIRLTLPQTEQQQLENERFAQGAQAEPDRARRRNHTDAEPESDVWWSSLRRAEKVAHAKAVYERHNVAAYREWELNGAHGPCDLIHRDRITEAIEIQRELEADERERAGLPPLGRLLARRAVIKVPGPGAESARPTMQGRFSWPERSRAR